MKNLLVISFLFASSYLKAQELFVFTEPASNMAAKSIGLRLNNYLMKEDNTGKYNCHLLPEIMVGISKKIMLHGELFISNQDNSFAFEGGSVYMKYRFFSKEEVHSHFRISAYGKYVFNNSEIHQPAIDFFGHSSGYEGGLIATQLINKVAVSASASVLHAMDNANEKFIYASANRNAVNYTLSVGKLMLPKEYKDYKQVNLNLICELLAQTNLGSGESYIDVAPSAQFIFNSRIRIDAGYRYPLVSTLYRTAAQGFILRLEYNVFNAY